MDNHSIVFDSHIKIDEIDAMSDDCVWPKNMEVCIVKIPIRKRDGYSLDFIKKFSAKIKNSMMINGKVFLVMYAPSESKSRPFEVSTEMVKAGFHHADNIIVERSWLSGKRAENMLVNSHDYVLFFVNGTNYSIDREPIKYYHQQADMSTCCGNIWSVDSGGLDDSISDDLNELLLMFSNVLPGSPIFAPLLGNCGILKACLKHGFSLTGFETDKRKLAQYEKIIENYKNKKV